MLVGPVYPNEGPPTVTEADSFASAEEELVVLFVHVHLLSSFTFSLRTKLNSADALSPTVCDVSTVEAEDWVVEFSRLNVSVVALSPGAKGGSYGNVKPKDLNRLASMKVNLCGVKPPNGPLRVTNGSAFNISGKSSVVIPCVRRVSATPGAILEGFLRSPAKTNIISAL